MTAQGSKRVSIAALIAAGPGGTGRARLIYRTHLDRGSGKHRRKGFDETDYARLLDGTHQALGGAMVLVWDNLPSHTSRAMRQLTGARLVTDGLPAPGLRTELNPVEALWSSLKRSLANLTKQGIDQLAAPVKIRLKRMQCWPCAHRRLPRQDPSRPHTSVTSTIEDLLDCNEDYLKVPN